jgi:plasmid stabilization system protein ParE
MKVLVENLAKQQLVDIYYYNYQYSLKNAIETNRNIMERIDSLEDSPYIGRYISEMLDNRFREIIYRKTRHSEYRIMYYISEKNNTIYVLNIINSRQDFKRILKLHNYFNNYFNF